MNEPFTFGLFDIVGHFLVLLTIILFFVWVWHYVSFINRAAKSSQLKNKLTESHEFAFAAADVFGQSEEEVEQSISECADIAEEIIDQMPFVRDAIVNRFKWELENSVGKILQFTASDFSKKLGLRFCLGKSLSGMKILPKTVMITLLVGGVTLDSVVHNWSARNTLEPDSIIHGAGYTIDVGNGTILLPNGVLISKGEVLSLEMMPDVQKKYLDEFASRNTLKNSLSKKSEYLSKLRIFDGFEVSTVDGNAKLEIKCLRFPENAVVPIPGGRTHELSKVNGYVIECVDWDEVLTTIDEVYLKAA